MKYIDKSHGIVQVVTIIPDINNSILEHKYTELHGTCINYKDINILVMPYVSCVTSIKFVTFHKVYNQSLKWSNVITHGTIYKKSKMWNYTFVKLENDKDIYYPKYLLTKYIDNVYIYGYGKYHITKTLFNPVHSKLPQLVYYKCDKNIDNIKDGTLVYGKNASGNKIFYIGYTYNNYITPFVNITFDNCNIKLNIKHAKISLSVVNNINNIRNTYYPCLGSNFKTFKKNDIILEINGNNIVKCKLFDYNFKISMNITTYLIYAIQHKILTRFLILRDNKIRELIFVNDELQIKNTNKIEVFSKNDYKKFSSDLCDVLVEENKYYLEIQKYLVNPYYKVKLFFSFNDNVNINKLRSNNLGSP